MNPSPSDHNPPAGLTAEDVAERAAIGARIRSAAELRVPATDAPSPAPDGAMDEGGPDPEDEARRVAAFDRLRELPALYRAGAIQREELVHDALAAAGHFDLLTRSTLHDKLEFDTQEHFCELWNDDHDCLRHTVFTQLRTGQERRAWLQHTEAARAKVQARLAKLELAPRRKICALLSKPETYETGLRKLWPRAGEGTRWHIARDISPESIDWLWRGRLARGKCSMLDGDPSQGKSTLSIDLAARISTGTPMPDETVRHEPAGVVLINFEDGLADTIRPRLEAAIDRIGAALIVVDPLMASVSEKADSHNDHSMRRALRPLIALAECKRVALLALRHRPKGGGRSAVMSGNGSVAIIGAARCGLLSTPDPDDPQNPHAHVIAGTKSNLSESVSSLRYVTIGVSLATASGPIETSRIEWRGTSSFSGDALVAREAANPSRRDAVREAMDQLAEFLKGGPKPAAEVYRHLGRDRHDTTLLRAKNRLGVQPYKTKGKDAPWLWALPTATELATQPARWPMPPDEEQPRGKVA